ncbi:MAG TPA: type 1 glutamine amidotransferase domain-containing protein [Devosia sp.]|uniref:type 1 glutamine amidotransferase domain-containing protein n=1 Tax=Devosia sp. TaxID=1871048 RepID=UPI002F92DFFA
MARLTKKRVLMLASNGFAELFEPRQALIDAGARVTIASVDVEPIEGVAGTQLGGMIRQSIKPDARFQDVDPAEFEALVLPGGVINPDRLRINRQAMGIVEAFADQNKLIAAICHAPSLLIQADLVRGRRVTGWLSLRTDLRNAGALVVDEPVVRDGNLLTSRMPDDLPRFCTALVEALSA